MTDCTRAETLEKTQPYFPVPFATLVVGTVLPFDLYSRIQERYILVRDAERPFEEKERKSLLALGESDFYVKREQQPRYISYLEEQVQRLLADPKRSAEERVESCFEIGSAVSRAALTEPESEQHLRMAQSLIDTSASMLRSTQHFSAFFHRMREDANLFVHSLHVTFYGLGLAGAAGIHDPEEVQELGLGLLFHDIGKLQLSPGVLEKPGLLDDDEWVEVYQHPLRGWERVESLPSFGRIARDVIENHHERVDGSGYPRGLANGDISCHARIAGIANAFDSHTTRRPHRPVTNSCQALTQMLQQKAGYDRDLLASFVKLLAGLVN